MFRWTVFLLLGLAPALPVRAETPRVAVSIAPIHSLVAGVMEGVAPPELMVKEGASPHTYALRPSDAKTLADATVVFWVGRGLETFLVKPLAALAGKAKVVELIETPGLRLLPYRKGAAWVSSHGHDHGHDHGHSHGRTNKEKTKKVDRTNTAEHADTDTHIWLAPANARILAAAIADVLAAADPANADRYRANGRKLSERLTALESEMTAALAPVRGRPFVVFHDAYQYLEDAFGLNALGAIAVAPEKQPGPKTLATLRGRIKSSGTRCIFREPQFPGKLAQTVAEGTEARIAVLDPEGGIGTPGPDHYFDLMRANARALGECLGGG